MLNNIDVQHKVPFEKIAGRKKIVLYGAGKRGKAYFKQLKCREDYEIALWVDKDYTKYKKRDMRCMHLKI